MEEFPIALALYFYDGHSFRSDIIDGMIDKLCELRELIRNVGIGTRICFIYSAHGGSGLRASFLHMKEKVSIVV